MYPDVELVLVELLGRFVSGPPNIGTSTPNSLAEVLPFVRVNRYGGPDNGVTDRAAVDVDAYAARRADAINLARQIHAFLTSGPHKVGSNLIDLVTTQVGVVERPRAAGDIRRFGGTYTVSCRREPV